MLAGELHQLNTWTAVFQSWVTPNRYQCRVENVAKACLQILRTKNCGTTMAEAFADNSLESLRGVFKQLPKSIRHLPLFRELSKELTAISLGITPQLLDRNAGFEEFAREGRIDRDLMYYNENILSLEGDIYIKFNGVFTPWNKVRDKLPPKPEGLPHRAWNYGPHGAQRKNLYLSGVEEAMTPTDIFPTPPWGNRFIFEFCVYYTPEGPRANGDHAWIRLGTPDGRSYEPGLYRPEKRGMAETFKFPFRRKKGYFQERDISVPWKRAAGEEIIRVGFEITPNAFLKMMDKLKSHARENDKTFHNSDESCVLFAKEMAALAGIHLPSGVSSIRALSKTHFFQTGWTGKTVRLATKIFDAIPWALQRVVEYPFILSMNLVTGVLAGGLFVDSEVRKNLKCRQDSFYSSLFDFFKPCKTIIHHPHFFAKDVLEPIKRERESKALALIEPEKKEAVFYPKFEARA